MKEKEKILKNSLLGYWIILPFLFFVILMVYSLESKTSYKELLTKVPGLAMGLLVACLSLILAFLLYSMSQKSEEKGNLKRFLFFAIFQQLISLNFIGLGLSYFYYKEVPKDENKQAFPILSLALMVLVGLLSLMLVFLSIVHYL